MCDKVNGWTNRETWLVNLWGFTEDEYADELARAGEVDELAAYLEESVTSYLKADVHIPDEGFAADLFSGALALVNWYELADTMASDYR